MTHGSLFSGIGGFDLAAAWTGIPTLWQVEIDPICQSVLKKHFPEAKIYDDIKAINGEELGTVDIISGGDPCQCRSKARSIHKTKIPDMSGYFLAMVSRSRPKWVVRENVPASDDKDFISGLEYLGYGTVIVSTNAVSYTAQNRERDFIVGYFGEIGKFISQLSHTSSNKRFVETKYKKVPSYPVLTTHRCRWDARDGYIWDGKGIRVADNLERCRLAGFPDNWLDGLPKTRVAKMTGNAVVPRVAYEIFKAITRVGENGM